MYYYLNLFFLFSILGHWVENFVYTKVDSGILYGFWTPIYGIGVLIILFIYRWIDQKNLKLYYKVPLLFVTSAIVLAIVESIGGYAIEYFLGRVFWSYEGHFLRIGKYTSLEMMLIWGIASLLVIYILLPLVNRWMRKIPKWITIVLSILFVIDFVATLLKTADALMSFYVVLIRFF